MDPFVPLNQPLSMTHLNPLSKILISIIDQNGAERNHDCANVLSRINPATPISEECVRSARNTFGSQFMRELFVKQVSKRFGIVSFCRCPYHPLMWSHYAEEGAGFVIGYNESEIRKIARKPEDLRPVQYGEEPPSILGPTNLSDEAERPIQMLLSQKSCYWRYEGEWRLIIELKRTIGTAKTDGRGHLINLLPIPNRAVVSVYYTERTCKKTVDLVKCRLEDENNRYRAERPEKLVMSHAYYGYEKDTT